MEESVSAFIDSVWPHDGYRENQKEIIADVFDSFFNDGNDFYVVSAPTGFGKSPVCIALSRGTGLLTIPEDGGLAYRAKEALELLDNGHSGPSGFYVTPQNILLDQLLDDYGELEEFKSFRGRSHYKCSRDNNSCAEGPCRWNQKYDCDQYQPEREKALDAPILNTNFSMFMLNNKIEKRPSLIIDEAHMMPAYVLQQAGLEIRADHLDDYGWEEPDEFNEFEEYVEWVSEKIQPLQDVVDTLKMTLERQAEAGSVDRTIANNYKKASGLLSKLKILKYDWNNHGEPWVVERGLEYDSNRGEEILKIKFKPVTPYRFMSRMVFDKAEKVVISSATPPTAKLLGVKETDTVVNSVESKFPIENRPFYYRPIGKMNKKNRKRNLPSVVSRIQKVAQGKTLIHAHTYPFAKKINDSLSGQVTEGVRLQDGNAREESVENWVESDDKYFVSINMYDGLDLDGDKCRTNIICVCPFEYLGDPQIKKRREIEGDEFMNWTTAMRIQQAYGRSTRSKEDHSNTFMLDKNFGWFFQSNKDKFFPWFKEAIDWQ